jgi:hypothetical protein
MLCLFIDIKTYENEFELQIEKQIGITDTDTSIDDGPNSNPSSFDVDLNKPKKLAKEIFEEYLKP